MKERIVEAAGELEAVVRRAGGEFSLVNTSNLRIPWEDYGNPQIPLSRVKADREEMTGILNRYFKECREKGQVEDFAFVFAAYCNLYIKRKMYSRLGTDDFEGAGDWFNEPGEQAEYFKFLWRGISQQEYSYFKKALNLHPESAISVMYLFVRAASRLCMVIAREQNTDDIAPEVWKYYDLLPEEYQEYVLGEGNFCRKVAFNDGKLADDPNLLPYINFKSMKEYPADNIFTKSDTQINGFFPLQLAFTEKTLKNFFLKSRDDYLENQELKQLNWELERQRRRSQEMMDFYIHSWKHISYPQTVKNAAGELRKKDLPLSNKLFRAYNSERTLKGNLQRLQYAFSDRPDEVSNAFREGFYCVGAAGGRKISDLLGESLDLVLFKMLMEDTDSSRRMKLCRRSQQARIAPDQLRQSYITYFVDNGGSPEDIFKWFDRNIFKMEVSVDHIWQAIPVMENSFGESQLMEIFAELFTNLLTHGADWCRVTLESNEEDLSICLTNGVGQGLCGSRKGLEGMENIVNKLNMNEVQHAVTGEMTKVGAFATKVILRRGLMYHRGRQR